MHRFAGTVPRVRIPAPAQYAQAALAGGCAACVTAVQPIVWPAIVAYGSTTDYSLSFIPVILVFASILGIASGVLVLSIALVVRAVVGRLTHSTRQGAIGAGTTVLLLGLAVSILVGTAGYGFFVWPVALVTVTGAALLWWQSLARVPR